MGMHARIEFWNLTFHYHPQILWVFSIFHAAKIRSNKISGSVDGSGNQVATLVVGSNQATQDKTYICKVQSSEYPQSAEAQVTAPLNIYGKSFVTRIRKYIPKKALQCMSWC